MYRQTFFYSYSADYREGLANGSRTHAVVLPDMATALYAAERLTGNGYQLVSEEETRTVAFLQKPEPFMNIFVVTELIAA